MARRAHGAIGVVARAPLAAAHSIGIDLGGTKTEALVLDPQGVERWRLRVPTPAGDYDATLRMIAALIDSAKQALALEQVHIGLGTPGSLTRQGLMKNCNSTCLNGRALQADLQTLLGQAVRIANDANCLALSEATDGAGAGQALVFAAILGTGVGAGISVHGRLLEGPNRLAGEWGHNPLPWAESDDPRPACYCGQAGCVETLVSGPAITRDHAAHGGAELTAADIAQRAAAGEAACAATLARWHSRLARALAQVVNILDPDVIVLGGGLSRIQSSYAALPALMPRWVFSGGVRDAPQLRIVPSLHGDSSGVRGAAWLWR
jgi:fructokinase